MAALAGGKLAPVPAAGCCSVSKPSSDTSLSVLEFARLVQDVIPKGVFNVITGSGSKSGQYMLDHKGFRKLAFTGSTEAGRQVALAAAGRLIPATLECIRLCRRKLRQHLLPGLQLGAGH